MAIRTLTGLINLAAKHAPLNLDRREAYLATVIQQGNPSQQMWQAGSAGVLTIPANTLQTGDIVEISGGFTCDGSSTAVSVTLEQGTTTVITHSDANTSAHGVRVSATLQYTGTGFTVLGATLTGGTDVAGATISAAATAAQTISLVVGSGHATIVGVRATLLRTMPAS